MAFSKYIYGKYTAFSKCTCNWFRYSQGSCPKTQSVQSVTFPTGHAAVSLWMHPRANEGRSQATYLGSSSPSCMLRTPVYQLQVTAIK